MPDSHSTTHSTDAANVPARELAERLARQSRLFERIASSTPDFIYVFDLDGRFLYANQRLLEVWGRSAEDAIGKNLYELGYPRWHADMHVRELRQVIETKRPVKGEVPFTGGSGISGVYEYIFTPVLGPDGEVEAIAGTTRDVTDRRRAEESKTAILESITDAFFAVDRDWQITYVNRQAQRVLNRQSDDLLGKVLWEVYPGLVGSEFETVYRSAAAGHEATSATAYYPDHDRWYEVRAYPGPEGLSVYFRDVSDRKRAEAELRESEERFRAAFEQSVVGILFADLEGRVTRVNDAFCALVGRSRDQLVGRTSHEYTHADDVGRNVDIVARLKAREAEDAVYEKRYVRPDGSAVVAQVSLSAIHGAAGDAVGVVAIVQDVTARKRAEDQDRFLLALEDETRPLEDPAEITRAHARLLAEHLRVDRCAYADFEPDGETFNLTGDYNRGVPSIVGRYTLDQFGEEFARLTRDGLPTVIDDVKKYPPPFTDPDAYAAVMIRAMIAVPLYKGGRPVAGLAVHSTAPRRWRLDEVELVQQVAARCWESIERARVQRSLRESEQRFRLMADAIPQIVWITDAEGRTLFFNQQWLSYTGVPFEATTAPDIAARFVHPDDVAATMTAFDEARRTSGVFQVEHRIRSAAGEYRWFIVRAVPYRDPRTGEITRWFGSSTDIHDRRRAEDALRRSEEQYRSLFDSIDQGFCVVEVLFDPRGTPFDYRFLEANRAFEQQTGLVGAVGRTARELVPTLEERWFQAYGRVAATGEAARFEEWSEPMGRWFDVYAFRTGAPEARRVAILFKDITAAKKVEAALRESERRFRDMADTAPAILWVTEADGYTSFLSRGWYELTGQTEETGLGFGWTDAAHPDDRDAARDSFVAATAARVAYSIDFRVRRADGVYRWVIDAGRPRFGPGGEFLGFIGSVIDITDRKLAEDERRRLLDSERAARGEAERQSRMKDDFLATLSHELRTPLNAILGWAQILRINSTSSAEDLAEGLATIERNARAQTQIIEDLLDMSRIISGKVRLDVQRVDLAAVVREAVATARPSADAKGIRLQMVLDPRAGLVAGDPSRLQQVLWNLLSNAIKFTPRGGRVQVVLERVNSHLEVSVVDTGEGIKPDFLPFVFDRFRQADATTTRRHGGLGLGLSIVKQLVELHGGSVRVTSAGAGQGATFTVSLPVTVIHAPPGAAPEADRRHPLSASAPASLDGCVEIAGVKVLVVDDEPDARALLKRLLEDCRGNVLTAGSAAEALELVRTEKPDVLVCDIGMPGEDGYSLITRVRALGPEGGGQVPAAALTAYARPEDRVKAVLAGFQMHLAKPVEPAELVATVASLAGRTTSSRRG